MHAVVKMASASASACCVCKTSISAGNRRLLNGPREVESNKKVRDFLNKFCHSPLNAPDIPSFICKSCFCTVEKASKHIQSAQHALDSLRQSLDLPLAQLELNSTVEPEPPAATPLRETGDAVVCSVPDTPIRLNEPIVEMEDINRTPGPPRKKPRRRLLPQLSHASESPVVQVTPSNVHW